MQRIFKINHNYRTLLQEFSSIRSIAFKGRDVIHFSHYPTFCENDNILEITADSLLNEHGYEV